VSFVRVPGWAATFGIITVDFTAPIAAVSVKPRLNGLGRRRLSPARTIASLLLMLFLTPESG
jgi:hypothetical protein